MLSVMLGQCNEETDINGVLYCNSDLNLIDVFINRSVEVYGSNFHKLNEA